MRRPRHALAFSVAFSLACSGAVLGFSGAANAQDLAPPSTGPSGTGAGTGAGTGTPVAAPESTRLTTDEKKDSGRGLEWVYLNAEAGVSYINLDSLSSSNFAVQNASSAGPAFGLGAGIRLFILTIGGKATLNELSGFNLWQLDGELGFHIPIGHWDPYFGLHGGYCFVGSLSDGISGSPNLSITGGDAGLQLGVDYYFNHFVSLGLDVSGHALFLHRAPVTLPAGVTATLTPAEQTAYQATGDSVGIGIAPTLHLGFHL